MAKRIGPRETDPMYTDNVILGYDSDDHPDYQNLNAILYRQGFLGPMYLSTAPTIGKTKSISILVKKTAKKSGMSLKEAMIPFGIKSTDRIYFEQE